MPTDQIALVVSIFSALIASSALGWNIYRDVVLKPKVVVSFSLVVILHETLPERPHYLNVTGTNFGPGSVTLNTIVAREAPFWRRVIRRVRYAFITPDYANQMSERLPKKLEPGDKVNLLLPFERECLLGHPKLTHVGLSDSYGRNHWASRKDMEKARTEWAKEFAAKV